MKTRKHTVRPTRRGHRLDAATLFAVRGGIIDPSFDEVSIIDPSFHGDPGSIIEPTWRDGIIDPSF